MPVVIVIAAEYATYSAFCHRQVVKQLDPIMERLTEAVGKTRLSHYVQSAMFDHFLESCQTLGTQKGHKHKHCIGISLPYRASF